MESRKKTWLAAFITIAAKLGFKLFAVAAKFFKFGMFAASFGAYAYLWNWQFAFILMGSLFVHEMGHVWAMKREGVPHRGINFIPFFGAVIVAEKDFPTRKSEAVIGIMGPIWGGALALATFGIYEWTRVPLIAAIAGWMAMLNLFNLLPVSPLDGGRVLKSVAFSIGTRVGLELLILFYVGFFALAVVKGFELFWIIMILGGMEIWMEWGEAEEETASSEYRGLVTTHLAGLFGILATREAVIGAIEDVFSYLRTIPLHVRLEHPTLASYIRNNTYDPYGRMDERPFLSEEDRTHAIVHLSGAIRYLVLNECLGGFCATPASPKLLAARGALKRKGIRGFLRGKPSMTLRQSLTAFFSYAALAILLAAILIATKHVEGAKHAMEVFT